MNAFISILYANTNTLTEEKIAVGIIYTSKQNAKMIYSPQKIAIAAQLLDDTAQSFLNQQLKTYSHTIHQFDHALQTNQKPQQNFDLAYFDYLHRYNRGLLGFSPPKAITPTVDTSSLQQLLLKFLGVTNV